MSSELKVGVLFFLGLGLATAFVFFVSNPFRHKGGYTVRFGRIVRLQAGDPVTFNGVKVGTVTGIAPVVRHDEKTGMEIPEVQVEYSVDSAFRRNVLIGPTTEFKIDQPVFGSAALAILSRSGASLDEQKKLETRGINPVGIDETLANINKLVEENRDELHQTITSMHKTVDRVGEASEQARDLIKENRQQIQQMISAIRDSMSGVKDLLARNSDNLSAAIQNIKDFTKKLDEMLAENREQLKAAVANFSSAAKTINETVAENRDSLKKAMDGVAKFAPRLDQIGENLQLITTQIAEGKGTIGKLVMEDTLHDKAVQTLDNVNQRAEEVKPFTQPIASLNFWGRLETGMDTRSGVTDTYAALRIEPRPWKFYEGGVSYRTAPRNLKNEKPEDPDKFHVDFNLLMGWRWFADDRSQVYRLTFAGGLIDSQVGGYVEVPVWDHWLKVRAMVRTKDNKRDPNDRRYEHGNALARVQFEFNAWRERVWLIAGGNDLTDQPGFWAGIRGELLDNDLRNITTANSLSR
jgi:ABC-type transporter Mla subunit MlaD